MKLVIIILLVFFGVERSFAQAPASVTSPTSTPVVDKDSASEVLTEAELRFRIKNRIYPGGKDEEFLKVQTQLIVPTRKMAPVTEAPSEPEETQETETQATD